MQDIGQSGKASIGMDANLGSALGYVIGIIDIIVLCTEKENKFVKFHALQALLFHIGGGLFIAAIAIVLVIINILLTVIGAALAGAAGQNAGGPFAVIITILWVLLYPLILILALGLLVVNIMSAVKAYNGKVFRLPIVGKFAASFAKLDQ